VLIKSVYVAGVTAAFPTLFKTHCCCFFRNIWNLLLGLSP